MANQIQWTEESTNLLIDLVRERSVIYQSSQGKHKDRVCIENAFRAISTAMSHVYGQGFTSSACETKWKGLRQLYIKKKREAKKPSGSAAGDMVKWQFFKTIDFFMAAEYHCRTKDVNMSNYGNANKEPLSADLRDSEDGPECILLDWDDNITTVLTSDAKIPASSQGPPTKVSYQPGHEDRSKQTEQEASGSSMSGKSAAPNSAFGGSSSAKNKENVSPAQSKLRKGKKRSSEEAEVDAAIASVSKRIEEFSTKINTNKPHDCGNPVGLALGRDLDKLPDDLRTQCQAELFSVMARYMGKVQERISEQKRILSALDFHSYARNS